MDIQRAKEEIKRAVQAYLATDDIGRPLIPAVRQRPILLLVAGIRHRTRGAGGGAFGGVLMFTMPCRGRACPARA